MFILKTFSRYFLLHSCNAQTARYCFSKSVRLSAQRWYGVSHLLTTLTLHHTHFIPGSKLTSSTIFSTSLLSPICGTAFSDYNWTGLILLNGFSFLVIFLSFYVLVVYSCGTLSWLPAFEHTLKHHQHRYTVTLFRLDA